jgi:hypothetical protein
MRIIIDGLTTTEVTKLAYYATSSPDKQRVYDPIAAESTKFPLLCEISFDMEHLSVRKYGQYIVLQSALSAIPFEIYIEEDNVIEIRIEP